MRSWPSCRPAEVSGGFGGPKRRPNRPVPFENRTERTAKRTTKTRRDLHRTIGPAGPDAQRARLTIERSPSARTRARARARKPKPNAPKPRSAHARSMGAGTCAGREARAPYAPGRCQGFPAIVGTPGGRGTDLAAREHPHGLAKIPLPSGPHGETPSPPRGIVPRWHSRPRCVRVWRSPARDYAGGGRPHRWGTVPPPEGVGVAAMPDRGISALPARAAGARPVGRCPNSRRRHVVVRRSPCRTAGRSARAGLSPVAGIGGRTWGRCYAPRRMSRLVTACLLVTLPTG